MTSISALSRRLVGPCIAIAAVAGANCKSTPTAVTDVPSPNQARLAPIISMQVVPDVASMRLGDSVTFSLEIELGEGIPPSGPMPIWSSTNPKVIAVDSNGRATALAVGETTIEAAAHGQRAARHLRVVP